MTHTDRSRFRVFALVVSALALSVVPSGARAQAPAPPAPRAVPAAAPLLQPQATPSPATHRPSAVPVAQRTPTAAVVLPVSPGGAPLDTTARQTGAGGAVLAVLAAPQPIARPVPPSRAALQSQLQAQAPLRSVSIAPDARPVGATMLCKDGSYLTGPAAEDRCDTRGGMSAMFKDRTVPTRVRQ